MSSVYRLVVKLGAAPNGKRGGRSKRRPLPLGIDSSKIMETGQVSRRRSDRLDVANHARAQMWTKFPGRFHLEGNALVGS
jgi:hypothetical protein